MINVEEINLYAIHIEDIKPDSTNGNIRTHK
jgi:hypothetical protein